MESFTSRCASGHLTWPGLGEIGVEQFADLGVDTAMALLRVDLERRLPVGLPGLALHEHEVFAGLEGECHEGSAESVWRYPLGQGRESLFAAQIVGDRDDVPQPPAEVVPVTVPAALSSSWPAIALRTTT